MNPSVGLVKWKNSDSRVKNTFGKSDFQIWTWGHAYTPNKKIKVIKFSFEGPMNIYTNIVLKGLTNNLHNKYNPKQEVHSLKLKVKFEVQQ